MFSIKDVRRGDILRCTSPNGWADYNGWRVVSHNDSVTVLEVIEEKDRYTNEYDIHRKYFMIYLCPAGNVHKSICFDDVYERCWELLSA